MHKISNKLPTEKIIRVFIISLLFLISFLFCTQNASADTTLNPSDCNGGCEDEISNALAHGGPTVTLNPGTYWITGNIRMQSNVTLQGTRTGKYTGGIGSQPNANTEAIIKVMVDKSAVSPLIGSDRSYTVNNVTMRGFTIDGNCDAMKQENCYRGHGGNTLVGMRGTNITFTNMYMRDCGMDGLRVRGGSNVTFSNNVVWRLGHDAFYTLNSNKVYAFGNEFFTWTNSAVRMGESNTGEIHDNIIYSAFSSQPGWTGTSTGPGIQLNESYNVNIYRNSIQNMRGSGVWIVNSESSCRSGDVNVYCNYINNVGKYNSDNGYSTAGVMIGTSTNIVIKNNYINNAGGGGAGSNNGGAIQNSYFRSYDFPGTYATQVQNNIIANSNRGLYNHPSYTGGKGQYSFISSGNCFNNIRNNSYYVGGNITNSGDTYSGCAATLECTATLPTLDPPSVGPFYPITENCTDKVDNDGDGKADCEDSDCINETSCINPPYIHAIDQKPIAIAGKDIYTIINRAIALDGSNSTDNDNIELYSWDFNASDGIQTDATEATATATYNTIGKYTVTLTVTDTAGQDSSSTLTVTVCGREADKDNDGFLNATCGGGDCDDNSSSVRPGSDCIDKCFGDLIMTGKCQENGQCSYDTTKSTCTNLGSKCKLDRCDDSSGIAVCITDFSADFCGGLIPCGRELDNPATEANEQDSCSLCHVAMLSNNSIQYLIEIASILALLALMISGLLYVMSAGNSEKKSSAKGYIMATIKGFAAIFLAWLIVDFVLSAWGFIDPLGGKWNVICDLFFPLLK